MRKKKTKKQKNAELRRRYDAIKNLMSTFAMSTVAVVAVVTLIPSSPKAEIIKTVALSEEITYQVSVTDEENALDPNSLFVVLENQLEYYEQNISLGENSGFFDNLEYDTQYRLSVYGSKGFGQERLDTVLLTTRQKIGGTILRAYHNTEDIPGDYIADISIYDPDMKYSSITLYYGQPFEHDGEIIYSSTVIDQDRMEVPLFDLWGSDPIHIYLEGITEDGSEILDEIWVTPPFELYASAYLERVGDESVWLYMYGDSMAIDTEFELLVYRNNTVVQTKSYIPDYESHEPSAFEIDNLASNTDYIIECYVNYKNPQTLAQERKLINTIEVTTLNDYSYTYDIVEFDTYYEVSVTVDDPFDYFQTTNYQVYDTAGDHEVYFAGNSYVLEIDGTRKTYMFTIDKPSLESYRIYIRINNQTDFNIFEVLKIIENE